MTWFATMKTKILRKAHPSIKEYSTLSQKLYHKNILVLGSAFPNEATITEIQDNKVKAIIPKNNNNTELSFPEHLWQTMLQSLLTKGITSHHLPH